MGHRPQSHHHRSYGYCRSAGTEFMSVSFLVYKFFSLANLKTVINQKLIHANLKTKELKNLY